MSVVQKAVTILSVLLLIRHSVSVTVPSADAVTPSATSQLLADDQNDIHQSTNTNNNNIIINELRGGSGGWMSSLDGQMEYQPVSNKLSPLAEYHWRKLTSSSSSSSSNDVHYGTTGTLFHTNPYQTMYADGSETHYDEYAQAWRVLGFFIDCDSNNVITKKANNYHNNNNNNNNNNNANNHQQRNNNQGSASLTTCRRYLLWAAYVDEKYSGHGPGEYMYYDRHNHLWDDSACTKLGNTQRCVKMDCHLPQSTHYTLLGYFKEPSYDHWIDTLTQYQGDCVWTDSEYTTMTSLSRTAWPQRCTGSIYTTKNDQVVYYDLRPMEYGSITVGLYIDDLCTQDYSGPLTAQEVLKGMVCGGYVDGGEDHDWNCGGSTTSSSSSSSTTTTSSSTYYNLQDHLQQWNAAFDAFKQCQPCKAYDLTSMVAGRNYHSNLSKRHPNRQYYNTDRAYPTFMCNGNYQNAYYNSYGNGGYGNDDDYNNNNNNDNNNNGENNHGPEYGTLNQCMIFRTQTSMIPATWTDVELAGTQGTITAVQLQPGSAAASQGGSSSTTSTSSNRYHPSYGKGLDERSRDNAHWIAAWLCLWMSIVVFCFALYRYCVALEEYTVEGMNDRLVFVHHPTAVSA